MIFCMQIYLQRSGNILITTKQLTAGKTLSINWPQVPLFARCGLHHYSKGKRKTFLYNELLSYTVCRLSLWAVLFCNVFFFSFNIVLHIACFEHHWCVVLHTHTNLKLLQKDPLHVLAHMDIIKGKILVWGNCHAHFFSHIYNPQWHTDRAKTTAHRKRIHQCIHGTLGHSTNLQGIISQETVLLKSRKLRFRLSKATARMIPMHVIQSADHIRVIVTVIICMSSWSQASRSLVSAAWHVSRWGRPPSMEGDCELNKQHQTNTKVWSSTLEVGRGDNLSP
jgi:hypothetical protein